MVCKIPLQKKYVKKWAIARYGDGLNAELLTVSRRNVIGKLLELSADKIGFMHVLPKPQECACVLVVEIPAIKNSFVHPKNLPLIGKTIEAFFDEDLFNTIAFHVSMGNSDYVAVQHFCDRYGLSIEDVNEENLRKKWRDHLFYMRKKMQTYS